MKRFLLLLALLCTIVLTVNITVNYGFYQAGGDWAFSICFSLIMTLGGWAGYVLLYYLFFRKGLNWTRHPNTSLALSVSLSGLYGISVMAAAMKLLVFTGVYHSDQPLSAYIGNSVYSALFCMLLGLIINGQDFLAQWRNAAAENERMQREILQSRYDTLKNQISPHFFFNALNTLNYLISGQPALASRFLQGLSRVFRYSMQYNNARTVLLEEELAITGEYLFLQQQRFEEKLKIEISVSGPAKQQHIVLFALLTLIENVIKHNEISTANPLMVTIYDEGNYLVVTNTLQPRKELYATSGTGLSNITDRYSMLSEAPVIIEQDTLFVVKIPLLSL